MEKLFTVIDVNVVPGKGLVLSPALPEARADVAVGAMLEMSRPDGGRLRTQIVSLEPVKGGLRICVPMTATIGPGTLVYLEESFSGFLDTRTGKPAAGPIHRPRLVPSGMRIAGGSGRRD